MYKNIIIVIYKIKRETRLKNKEVYVKGSTVKKELDVDKTTSDEVN